MAAKNPAVICITRLFASELMQDWPTAELRFSAPILIPRDPFALNGEHTTVVFTAGQLRELFVNRIYKPLLRPFFEERFKLGNDVLDGAPIHVVLLSSGSANIGWLRQLLQEDFFSELETARFVQILDFQQVVAQGLAVDRARTFASGTSEFKAVTYNPLFLLLEPDGAGCDPIAFTPRTEGLPDVKNRLGMRPIAL